MSTDHDDHDDGLEAVREHSTQLRQDTASIIQMLEERRNSKKEPSPPDTDSTPGSSDV